jgi:hypothetical protein
MKTLFSRPLAYGLVALGLIAGAATPLQAGPLSSLQLQAPVTTNTITPVRDSWAGGGPRSEEWRWRRGDRGWRHNRHWRGDWERPRWRNDDWRWRRHHRREYYGLGGFGLGLGLGLAAPRYYDNYYVAPRRVYRGLSPAHVRWCSARYRTYRAWDNTYVPRVGYRAVCRSPFG